MYGDGYAVFIRHRLMWLAVSFIDASVKAIGLVQGLLHDNQHDHTTLYTLCPPAQPAPCIWGIFMRHWLLIILPVKLAGQ